MKISFFHDAPLLKDEEDKFYSIGFSYSIWERYLRIIDKLIVATRMRKINKQEKENIEKLGYKLSSGNNVVFSPINSYRNLKSFILNYHNIKNEIKEVIENSDGVIIRLPSVIGIIACREAKRQNKKFLIETVACAWDSYWNYGTFLSKLLAGPMCLFQKRYTKNAPFVIYITSEYLQNRYPTKGIETGCVANVMISVPTNQFIKRRKEKIKEFDKRPISIGLIGSLDVNYKGHKTAIQSLAYLKSRDIDANLYFVGAGKKEKWFNMAKKYKVEDNIYFVGTISSGSGIYNWLDSIDFYIQPSTAEGHGRALVEAVSRGCICFGSNIGGIPDTLKKEYLFPKNDYKKLAKLIMFSIESEDFAINNIGGNIENIVKYEQKIIESKRDLILNEFNKSIVSSKTLYRENYFEV